MKKCPSCNCENADDALECKNCLEELPINPIHDPVGKRSVKAEYRYSLVIVKGVQRGECFRLEDGVNDLGRIDRSEDWIPAIDLTAQEEDNLHYVSRRHASMRLTDGKVYLKDIGSLHGTVIEGKGKVNNRETLLAPGDIIRLGRMVQLRLDMKLD